MSTALQHKALFKWNSTLETGVIEIDNQHKQLIDLLNGLYLAMKQGQGNQILGQLIHGLGNYILQHFSLEERYMELTRYPASAAHIEEHRAFARKIIDFDREFKQGNVLLTVEVMHYLRDWVSDHIARCDQELGRHLRIYHQH
jgi:hemerythrin